MQEGLDLSHNAFDYEMMLEGLSTRSLSERQVQHCRFTSSLAMHYLARQNLVHKHSVVCFDRMHSSTSK